MAIEPGLRPGLATEHRSVRTFGGVARSPVIQVLRIRVLGQQVERLVMALADLPPKLGLDAVLGLKFLQHSDLRINFREQHIELR